MLAGMVKSLIRILFVVCVCCGITHADRPNVVIIMADDMGYSDIGCFGGEIRTPNLDRLAEGGLRFTNFYSENMCWVSRAALLTGIYHRTSMVNSSLHPRCVTLPETLSASNYHTIICGKWHLAGKNSSVYPLDRGFQSFYGILGGASSFFAPYSLSRNRKNVEAEAKSDPDYYFTNAISDEAVKLIKGTKSDRPVFLNLTYTAAHWPLHAPEKDIAKYSGKYAMGWDALRQQRLKRMKSLGILPDSIGLSPRHEKVPAWEDADQKEWQQRRMEVYAAQVTIMDTGIGRVIEALKQTGRFENTLVFFTIDNGGCHVEYGTGRKGYYLPTKTRDGKPMKPGNIPGLMPGPEDTYQSYGYGWANASNTPYRLFKQFDHEGGIRTPMIAHWPKGISQRGQLVRTVSHLIDIMPTVLEVTGAEAAAEINGKKAIERDGQSLAPAFKGETVPDHETLFFHHAKGRALRYKGWKLVSSSRKKWELYNLNVDPLELNDLSKKKTDRLKELVAIWESESKRLEGQAKLK